MENTQFEVRRDGQIDPEFKRKILIRKAKASIRKSLRRTYSGFKTTLEPILTEYELYTYDSRHGTQLRSEYIAKRRQASVSATRQQFGL